MLAIYIIIIDFGVCIYTSYNSSVFVTVSLTVKQSGGGKAEVQQHNQIQTNDTQQSRFLSESYTS